jgi:hypothetical protein
MTRNFTKYDTKPRERGEGDENQLQISRSQATTTRTVEFRGAGGLQTTKPETCGARMHVKEYPDSQDCVLPIAPCTGSSLEGALHQQANGILGGRCASCGTMCESAHTKMSHSANPTRFTNRCQGREPGVSPVTDPDRAHILHLVGVIFRWLLGMLILGGQCALRHDV